MTIEKMQALENFPDGKHPTFKELFKNLQSNERISYMNYLNKQMDQITKYCDCIELLSDEEIEECCNIYQNEQEERDKSKLIIGGLYGKGYFN
jgi:hypothetical protein